MKQQCQIPGCTGEPEWYLKPPEGSPWLYVCWACWFEAADKGVPKGHYYDYFTCRINGWSHAGAMMMALASPPMSNTDREFLQGHVNGSQFQHNEARGDYYAKAAKEAGVSTTGKVYISGLAEFPGDPRAWVSGRGEAQRVCEERGWEAEGAVNVKGRQFDHGPPIELADDIVEAEASRVLAKHPEPQTVNHEELKHTIREKRKPRRK